MEPGIIGSYSTIMWTQIRHLGLFAKNYQWPLAYFVFSVVSVHMSDPLFFCELVSKTPTPHNRNLTVAF